MFDTPNRVLAAADTIKIDRTDFDLVDANRWRSIFHTVVDNFCDRTIFDQRESYLWEALDQGAESKHLTEPVDATRLGGLSNSDDRVYLLLEDWDGAKYYENYWLFDGNLSSVLSILGELHLIEFYIVDPKFKWLIGENHHNVVFAAGKNALQILRHVDAA